MQKAIAIAALIVSGAASAQVPVQGYVRQNGTYVAPSYRSAPNNTTLDNYGTRPNVNPYTGQQGTANPYPIQQPQMPSYPSYPSSYLPYPGTQQQQR